MRKLNYNNNYKISRNEWTFYQRITPNISNSSDITPIYFNNSSQKNKNKSLKKDILIKEENKTDYIKKEKNIMNISTDKIIVGDTINNNDIKYIIETSNNSYLNNFQNLKSNLDSNKILNNYIIRLTNFGFPEIGEIYLSKDIYEQEKTFNFLEYLINKETNNLEMNNNKEKENKEQIKKIKILENEIFRLKEVLNLKENQISKLNKKLQKNKNFYEHQYNQITKDNENLKFLNNKISHKNKNLEFRLQSLNKSVKKFENLKSNIINAVEVIDNVQNKDMEKMFSRVKNTEKLLESLKKEYNESLKELSFQVNSFKNFIFEIHDEIRILLKKPSIIENNVYNLPFLELINYLKKIFKKNFELLNERINMGISEDYE